ncbi:hypothetical protein M272_16835 [Vibrio natriegens NBRC 15636 = ATCC 14048 = DSM 759]|nr:hypothetical protein M272_16835 [Vibrio natriegens NBRC 15636 = ATCC 14048 = DSM 759]
MLFCRDQFFGIGFIKAIDLIHPRRFQSLLLTQDPAVKLIQPAVRLCLLTVSLFLIRLFFSSLFRLAALTFALSFFVRQFFLAGGLFGVPLLLSFCDRLLSFFLCLFLFL